MNKYEVYNVNQYNNFKLKCLLNTLLFCYLYSASLQKSVIYYSLMELRQ